ncbi:50S ribosomal protein L5 [soil metagenome]
MEPTLLTEYKTKVVPALQEKLGYKNIHQVPRIEKIVINSCVGNEADRKAAIEEIVAEVNAITGQRPIVTLAKKSVANFKLREGEAIGVKVTLRGNQMWDFLLRFMRMAIPRIRDFRGVPPKSFDGRGNYTMGVSDQSIFPEVELEKVKRTIGFDITIVTTATNDEDARALLTELGMPFRKPAAQSEAAA